MPAIAGPTTRATLTITELRLTALRRSSGPTISSTNDCRAGFSKQLSSAEQQRQHVDLPERDEAGDRQEAERQRQHAHRGLQADHEAALVHAVGDDARRTGRAAAIGRVWSATTAPSAVPEPVSFSTSQDWAIICIQVPTSETAWPRVVAAVVRVGERRERLARTSESVRQRGPSAVVPDERRGERLEGGQRGEQRGGVGSESALEMLGEQPGALRADVALQLAGPRAVGSTSAARRSSGAARRCISPASSACRRSATASSG